MRDHPASRDPERPRRRLPALLLGALLAPACAMSDLPADPVLKPFDLDQRDFPLKSGFRVLVQEDHTDPIVVVVMHYGTGSSKDPAGKEGVAHFVEHMAFRTRPAPLGGKAVWDVLKRSGAAFNAFTAPDETVYHELVHKDYAEQFLQLEVARMLQPVEAVTEQEFATEREVVRNELRQRKETGFIQKIFDLLFERAFPPGHTLHRPMAGTPETMLHITLQDTKDFASKWYRPDNATLVIAGDVTRDEVQKWLGKLPAQVLFNGGDPAAPARPPRQYVSETPLPPVPPPADTKLGRATLPVTQPMLAMAWSIPGAHRGNDAKLQFAAVTLRRAMLAGLYNPSASEEEGDDIQNIDVFPQEMADASVMMVIANLKPGASPEKARKRLLDSLARAWTTDIDTGDSSMEVEARREVEFAKWFTATGQLMDSDDVQNRAIGVAVYLAATGHTQFFKETFEELAAVQKTEMSDFAAKWLTRDRAVSVYIEPESSEVPRTATGAGGGSAGSARAEHEVSRGATGGEDLEKEYGPEQILRVARPPGLDKLPRTKLPNGLDLVTDRRGLAPLARVFMSLRGGDATSTPYGLASFADIFAGTTCMEHGDANWGLGPVGGDLIVLPEKTDTVVNVVVPAGNIGNGLAVLGDTMACYEVRDERFLSAETLLKRRQKTYERLIKRPEYVASRELWGALYPNHPYGQVLANPAELKKVGYAQANALVKSIFQPGGAVAVVLGDVDPAEVKTMADKYLTRWQGGGMVAAVLPPPPGPAGRKLVLVDRPGATQAEVQIGCRLPAVTPETVAAFDLASGVVSEELWQLREQWGATYGVYGFAGYAPGGAAQLIVNGAIENAQVGTSLVKILDTLANVGTGQSSEETFLIKRWDLARSFSSRFTNSVAIAGGILEAADEGWPADVWEQYPRHLAALTRTSLGKLINPCIDHEIITVVGDAKVLRPQIEAVGLPVS